MSITSLRAKFREQDRGATLILVAIMITALFTIVAIVIDLGALRSQRREGQAAVDASASAGGIALRSGDGQSACLDALGYLVVNLEVPAFTGTSCTTFAGLCDAATPERTTTGTSGPYTVTLVYPVTATSPTGVMDGGAIGRQAQTTAPDGTDGTPCERFGVKINVKGQSYFGKVVGLGGNDTSVHAVARVESGNFETRPLNLLILDRSSCQTLDVSGQARVIVQAPIDPDTGEFVEGLAATDSDATSSCSGNRAVIEATGLDNLIQANGPCPSDPFARCDAEGLIELFSARSTPLTNGGQCIGNSEQPNCRGHNSSDTIRPDVRASLGRFTRAPIDYRYNCKPSYTSESWYGPQPIPACTSPVHGNYMDVLKAYANNITTLNNPQLAAAGWTRISGNTDCSINGGTISYPPGNYLVDCPGPQKRFSMSGGSVEFQGGNVIFAGDVTLSSSSTLLFNTCPPSAVPACGSFNPITWTSGMPFTAAHAAQSSADAAWVFSKRDFSRSSSGDIALNKTMLVLDPGAASQGSLDFTGGTGSISWTAPDLTDWAFDDLALWSESTQTASFSGQPVLTLEGVFFVPRATASYAGPSGIRPVDAQFIANKLSVSGQGTLIMAPAPNRSIEFPVDPTSGLIR